MYKLGPCCSSVAVAVAVAVANDLTADPAVEAVNLAATELTAALVLRRRRGRDDDGSLDVELRGLLHHLLLQRSSNTSCSCSGYSASTYHYSHCPFDGALRRETRSSIPLVHCVDWQCD